MHCSYLKRLRIDGTYINKLPHLTSETAVHCFLKKCLNDSTTPTSTSLQKPTLVFCSPEKLLFLARLLRIHSGVSTAGPSRAQALPEYPQSLALNLTNRFKFHSLICMIIYIVWHIYCMQFKYRCTHMPLRIQNGVCEFRRVGAKRETKGV